MQGLGYLLAHDDTPPHSSALGATTIAGVRRDIVLHWQRQCSGRSKNLGGSFVIKGEIKMTKDKCRGVFANDLYHKGSLLVVEKSITKCNFNLDKIG